MSDEVETRCVCLRRIYLWTALYLLLGSVLMRWTSDTPLLVEWVRQNRSFLWTVCGGAGVVCMWSHRYLTLSSLRLCIVLFVASAAILYGAHEDACLVDGVYSGVLYSGVLFGLATAYGYLTRRTVEGIIFSCLCAAVSFVLLVLFLGFSSGPEEADADMVYTFACYTLACALPHRIRMYCYLCGDASELNAKAELRGILACLAYPFFLFAALFLVSVLVSLCLFFFSRSLDYS